MYYDGKKLSTTVSFDAMGGGEAPGVAHVVISEAVR